MDEDPRLYNYFLRHYLKLELRDCIGKTDDIRESLCMHKAIVAREMAQKGVCICRVCNKPLPDGVGRNNDFLILRHPLCVQPICLECSKENPDAYHIAFKKGIYIMDISKDISRELGNPPTYMVAARMAYEAEMAKREEAKKHV